jgi:hypothetical protein
VGAEFLHAYGQTDMKKLIVAFRNFANPPKIIAYTLHLKYEITESVSTMEKTACVSTQSEFRPSWITSV